MKKGILSGIRVIEFSGLAPSPYCGMLLSDFGADVILVERCDGRNLTAPFFSRGKRSLSLDLKEPTAVKALQQIIRKSDVVIDPFRPGKLEKLGLGPKQMINDNPRLVYAHLTGWGQNGPLANTAGHDINYLAISGALSAFSQEGGRPLAPVNYLADFAGGSLFCTMGILLALQERTKSGLGQVVDCSMMDGINSMSTFLHAMIENKLWNENTPGNNLLDSGAPFYDTYACKDGRFIAVGAIEPEFYAEFLDGLGVDTNMLPNPSDQSRWAELKEIFSKRIKEKTREEWMTIFEGKDACVSPVLSMSEAKDHPQVATRVSMYNQPEGAQLSFPSIPAPYLDRTPASVSPVTPSLGEHTEEIFKEFNLSKL